MMPTIYAMRERRPQPKLPEGERLIRERQELARQVPPTIKVVLARRAELPKARLLPKRRSVLRELWAWIWKRKGPISELSTSVGGAVDQTPPGTL